MSQQNNHQGPPSFGSNPTGGASSGSSRYSQGGNAYGSAPSSYPTSESPSTEPTTSEPEAPTYGSAPQASSAPNYGSAPQGESYQGGPYQGGAAPQGGYYQGGAAPQGASTYGTPGAMGDLPPQAYDAGSENYWQASQDDRTMGWLVHLLGIFTSFLGPLIMYVVKKDESPFIRHHSAQSLNFQITVLIGYIVSGFLMIVGIGYLTYFLCWIASIVFEVLAIMKAKDGQGYKIPMAIQMVK